MGSSSTRASTTSSSSTTRSATSGATCPGATRRAPTSSTGPSNRSPSRSTPTRGCSPARSSSTRRTAPASGRRRTRLSWRCTPAPTRPPAAATASRPSRWRTRTDDGQTWTKYSGNPVIDIGSREFRDPKVFWYEPAQEWRMVAVIANEHKVLIWRSADLKQLDPALRVRPAQRHRRRLGVPGPVPPGGRR